jgi:hypothetical protein
LFGASTTDARQPGAVGLVVEAGGRFGKRGAKKKIESKSTGIPMGTFMDTSGGWLIWNVLERKTKTK